MQVTLSDANSFVDRCFLRLLMEKDDAKRTLYLRAMTWCYSKVLHAIGDKLRASISSLRVLGTASLEGVSSPPPANTILFSVNYFFRNRQRHQLLHIRRLCRCFVRFSYMLRKRGLLMGRPALSLASCFCSTRACSSLSEAWRTSCSCFRRECSRVRYERAVGVHVSLSRCVQKVDLPFCVVTVQTGGPFCSDGRRYKVQCTLAPPRHTPEDVRAL